MHPPTVDLVPEHSLKRANRQIERETEGSRFAATAGMEVAAGQRARPPLRTTR